MSDNEGVLAGEVVTTNKRVGMTEQRISLLENCMKELVEGRRVMQTLLQEVHDQMLVWGERWQKGCSDNNCTIPPRVTSLEAHAKTVVDVPGRVSTLENQHRTLLAAMDGIGLTIKVVGAIIGLAMPIVLWLLSHYVPLR